MTPIAIIGLLILFLAAVGWARTYKTQHSPNQARFLQGKIPADAPNGFYKGSVTGYSGSWQGKTFDTATQRGVNIIRSNSQDVPKYPFATSVGPGLRDPQLPVIKIDYNLPENAWWLRYILDEIVEVAPNTFLGKIHIRLPLGLPTASIGYFTLEK